MALHEGAQDFDAEYTFGFVMTAISALDTASKQYFGACATYAAAPTNENLAGVNETAKTHTQAFRIAAIALNSDTEAAEFLKLLDALLLEQDAARVRALNEALGAEVLEAVAPLVDEESSDDEEDIILPMGDDEQLKTAYQDNCAKCHTRMLNTDTQTFVDIVSEAA